MSFQLNEALEMADNSPEWSAIFAMGWQAALDAVLSDATYYNALSASPSAYVAVEEAVKYVR